MDFKVVVLVVVIAWCVDMFLTYGTDRGLLIRYEQGKRRRYGFSRKSFDSWESRITQPDVIQMHESPLVEDGERRVSHAILDEQRKKKWYGYLIENVTLPASDAATGLKTTQVDQIFVSTFGVFIIETKNYNGKFYASTDDDVWVVYYKASKHCKLRNPLRQNHAHVHAFKALFPYLEDAAIIPLVVFAGNATFSAATPRGVYTIDELPHLFGNHSATPRLNEAQVEQIVGRLFLQRLPDSQLTHDLHVAHLQQRETENIMKTRRLFNAG